MCPPPPGCLKRSSSSFGIGLSLHSDKALAACLSSCSIIISEVAIFCKRYIIGAFYQANWGQTQAHRHHLPSSLTLCGASTTCFCFTLSCYNICALFFAHVIRYTIHLYVLYSYLTLFSHMTFILPHENAHTTLTYYLSTFPSLALLWASSDVHRVRWTHCCIMAHVPDYRNLLCVRLHY